MKITCISLILFYNIRHDFYVKSSAIGQSGKFYPMETKNSTFHLEPHGQQKCCGRAIVVDHSSLPFFKELILRYLNSVYDCSSALCPKVPKTCRTSACRRTMSACLLTERKRCQSLGVPVTE